MRSDEQLAAIFEGLTARFRAGARVSLEQAVEEFPAYAADLRELWTTLLLTEELAQDLSGLETVFEEPPLESRGLPKRLGDYELGRELGRGGMGVVFEARQVSLNRQVAVKMILRGEFATAEELSRFRGEAESAARLEHPNIVAIYEVGEHDEQPYFSMQLVRGTTLARRLADGPLPAREAAELMLPVCRAVAHAHSRGILHRDLKPSNILIESGERPLVTDFGLAKRLHQAEGAGASAPVTRTGDLLGTPGYMAPEQAAGNRGQVSALTDVYALGAILYATMTGRPPFQAASPVDTLMMVLEQDPPIPRLVNQSADPDLELIALKALQKPADLRYASADALASDLQAFLNHEAISARSSHFSQIVSRAFRPTHHAAVLEHWGLLWMWHAVVIFALCIVTNAMQLRDIDARWPYATLWTVGLGTWALIFWNLRRRAGPVTFVERQIAHIWAASMATSTMLFAVEWLLGLQVLKLSPVLGLVAGSVFIVKAGILSGEFYFAAALLFASSLPMAIWPKYGLTIFGFISWLTFFVPGWKLHRLKQRWKANDENGHPSD